MPPDLHHAEEVARYLVRLLTHVHPIEHMDIAEALRAAASLHGARLLLVGLRLGGGRAEALLASAEARVWAHLDALAVATDPTPPVSADARH